MTKKRYITLAAIVLLACTAVTGFLQAGTPRTPEGERAVHDKLRALTDNKIAIRIGDKSFTVDLYDNPTADDLLTKLPMTVKANNYPGYDEKVIRLKTPLSMKDAPRGDEPKIPEVGYYDPGQWIALYYGDIGYWPGKVPLGQIHATVDELRAIPDDAPVTIELLKD